MAAENPCTIAPMLFAGCEVCDRFSTVGAGVPVGVTCSCGRHFHIGAQLLARTGRCVRCPSCERRVSPLDVQDAAA